jgi:hypothetical protein
MEKIETQVWYGKVNNDGTIEPQFEYDDIITIGTLKYLTKLKGEYVKITIEHKPSKIWGGEQKMSILDFFEHSAKAKIDKDGYL